MAPRIPLPTDKRTPLGVPDVRDLSPELWAARRTASKAINAMGVLDLVSEELGRLRNARYQHCNL